MCAGPTRRGNRWVQSQEGVSGRPRPTPAKRSMTGDPTASDKAELHFLPWNTLQPPSPTFGESTLISSFRNLNFAISLWNLSPQLFTQVSSTYRKRDVTNRNWTHKAWGVFKNFCHYISKSKNSLTLHSPTQDTEKVMQQEHILFLHALPKQHI